MLNDPPAGGGAEQAALFRVSEQRIDRPGKGQRVFDGDEHARSVKRGTAGYASGHDRGTAGHGLKQDQGHPVVAGGDDDNIGCAEMRRGIGAEAGHLDPAGEAQGADLMLDRSPVLAIPDQPEACPRRPHLGESGHGHIGRALIARPPDTATRGDSDRLATGPCGQNLETSTPL